MKGSVTWIGVLALFVSVVQLRAIYVRPEIENVPVERLISNLEQLVAKEPRNTQTRFNLARVYSMAFALKMTPDKTVQVLKGRESAGVYFGPEVDNVPFRATGTTDASAQKLANEYLSKAIEHYRQVVELDPANLVAKLGYAWSLDQSGDPGKAITAYRHVIGEGWMKEQQTILPRQSNSGPGPQIRNSVGPGYRSITIEAAGYLIPLLDADKDRDEIATLRERISAFSLLGRAVTPIIIPLRDDLVLQEMIDNTARVRFDADGSGILREWTWITPNAGWLVYAPDGARPTSALQMFGNVTFWLFWDNGYQALHALDDNADGSISGPELEGLAIWRDTNINGVAEDGEVKSVAAWEIRSLSWQHAATPRNKEYAAFSSAGVTFENGRTRPTYDILLYANAGATERAGGRTE